eukprot:EG_transcript_32729
MSYRKCSKCGLIKDANDCSLHHLLCNTCFKKERKIKIEKEEVNIDLIAGKPIKALRAPEASSLSRLPPPGAYKFNWDAFGLPWSMENRYTIGQYYHEKLHPFDISKAAGSNCKRAVEMLNATPQWPHDYAVCFDSGTGHYYLLPKAGAFPSIQEALKASFLLSTHA